MLNQLSTAVKSSIRNFQKNRVYGSLNILGLAIAFTTLILASAYLFQETTYESFHSKADRIYRATYHFANQSGYDVEFARTPAAYINELPNYFPEIDQLIRFQNKEQKYVRIGEERFKPKHAYQTDSTVFEVFDFPLIAGNPKTVLNQPNSVVLTESAAKKYFSSLDVVGKEIMVTGDFQSEETPFKITGVMQDVPVNTHLPVDLFYSFSNAEERLGWAYVYVLLKEEADIEQVNAKMSDFNAEHYDVREGTTIEHIFQPLLAIHLTSNLAREIKPNGQQLYVKIFAWVGLLVWLIALVNFANLNAALSMSRGKEMGVRKVLGATKRNLVLSSFTESVVYSLVALGMGGLMAFLLFPLFGQLTGISIFPPLKYFIPALIGLAILSGIIAGILPAITATSMQMLQIIKQGNNWSLKSRTGSGYVRRGMIALQFCATVILVASALIAHRQFQYIQSKNLGLKSEQVLTIASVPGKVTDDYLTFKNRLKSISAVKDVTACMQMPSSEIRDVGPVRIQGQTEQAEEVPMMDMQIFDPDFIRMMQLELLAGEDFTANTILQKTPTYTEELTPQTYLAETPRKYLINETAMKQLGWETPEAAIGQQINWAIGNFVLPYGPVTGVVKDYHQESLKNQVDPLLMTVEPIWLSNILIKVETANLDETIAEIESTWNGLFPYALEYSFLDELFTQLYQQDRVQLQLLSTLALIAVFISFLGLVSLVAYALRTRSKELAIRRVIGANLTNLAMLIGKEYFWILLIAILVGIPVSYRWVSEWLQHFAYRIELSPLIYVAAVVPVFALVVGTVFFQTFRATVEAPVRGLREE